ncbi:hypothetical protein V6N11_066277 [Hibiscus sabdariffa]|uniref:Uncharacterized protein n=1 Tax=Hibiscus sabdariffa TaxID=183260 RepID=A0ABR1ZEC1_9ROSI
MLSRVFWVGKTGYPISLPKTGPSHDSYQFLETRTSPDQTESQIPGTRSGTGGNWYRTEYPINWSTIKKI